MKKNFTVKYTYEQLCKETNTYPVVSSNYLLYGFVLLIIGIIFMIIDKNNKTLSMLVIIISIVIIGSYIYCMPAVREKLYDKRSKKVNEAFKNGLEYDYDFNDNGFSVTSKVDGLEKFKSLQYKDIKIFAIGKNSLYFFNDGKKMYMCPKTEFSNEEINEFIKIFKDNKVKVIK